MRLEDYLLRLGDEWVAAHGRALSTLGAALANDGKFFTRLAAGASVTTARFQDALIYFRDPGNWPDAAIPAAAQQMLGQLQGIANGADGNHHATDIAA